MARSIALSLRNIGETLAISVPTVVDAARGRLTRATCDERLFSWAGQVVGHLQMTIHVAGREHFDPERTFLVMSNHQSHYDIPVLFHVLGPRTLRMIAKVELFRFPFFGRAMREAGFIAIDRGSRAAAIASLEKAKSAMRSGINVWIAPEGTRSATGALLPFKKGGFHLALDVGAPVLPITIRGTRDALPRGAGLSRPGAYVEVAIHRPIDVTPYSKDASGIAALSADVRAAIEGAL